MNHEEMIKRYAMNQMMLEKEMDEGIHDNEGGYDVSEEALVRIQQSGKDVMMMMQDKMDGIQMMNMSELSMAKMNYLKTLMAAGYRYMAQISAVDVSKQATMRIADMWDAMSEMEQMEMQEWPNKMMMNKTIEI